MDRVEGVACKRNWSVSDSHITNDLEILSQIDEIITSLPTPIRLGLGGLGQEHALLQYCFYLLSIDPIPCNDSIVTC